MGSEEVGNKFTWVIKNFSTLQYEKIYSDPFVIGGCKWHLLAYPKGNKFNNCLSLYLVVDDSRALPCGWRRYAQFSLTLINQLTEKLSQRGEKQNWFNQRNLGSGFTSLIPLSNLHAKNAGYLVNGEVKIVVEINDLEVIGKLDVSEESEEANQPLKKIKLDDNDAVSIDSLNEISLVKESIDVNGFQVLPSQVESVRRIFEKHPEIAVGFQVKNQHLRKTFMNFLVNVIETLCQSLQELSNEDLVEVDIALTYLKDAGFKVDWLEKKLDQVKEKKEKEQSGLSSVARLGTIEEELQKLKHMVLDLEAQLQKEKAKVLAARAPFSFKDVVY
ncbi:unnamed protein product [Arabidopsis halleri]